MYDLDGDGQISKVTPSNLQGKYSFSIKNELVAVLTMMVDGLDKKEVTKMADRFIEEIDKSEVSQ